MNNAEAKRKSRDMREIMDELAVNPDTDFKLFLNNLLQSLMNNIIMKISCPPIELYKGLDNRQGL